MHHAASYGYARLTHFLIACGAEIDVPTDRGSSHGNTPLMTMNFHYNREGAKNCVKLLLSRGASVDSRNDLGRSPRERLLALNRREYREIHEILRAGSWRKYVTEPRARVFTMRTLVARGRATPPSSGVLERLFGARSRVPPPVAFHVLTFWRTDRDSKY